MNTLKLILSFLIVILTSCNQANYSNTNSLKETLKEISKSNYYSNVDISRIEIEKKVSYTKKNITLDLAFDKISYPREIQAFLIIDRKDFGTYTIPLLSNTFRNYWEFQNEKPNKYAPNVSTTFEKEMKKCFQCLKLSDTNNLDWFLIEKIFVDGLNCRKLEIDKENNFGYKSSNSEGIEILGEDNFYQFDSLVIKNRNTILRNQTANSSNFYFDDLYNRIYEVHYKNINWRKDSCNFEIKTYRFEELKHEIHI